MSSLRLDSVQRNPNLYQVVSAGLSEAIKEAGLGPGDKIPSERELGEQFGVSRPVIREAIRHLAAKGILEVRTGSGVRLATIGHEAISESIELYLTQRGALDPATIVASLGALELRATELAAEHAGDDDLERLRSACEDLATSGNDAEATDRADEDFHRAIARAAGDDLLAALINSLRDVLKNADCKRNAHDQLSPDAIVEHHRRIADALTDHEVVTATAAMAELHRLAQT